MRTSPDFPESRCVLTGFRGFLFFAQKAAHLCNGLAAIFNTILSGSAIILKDCKPLLHKPSRREAVHPL